MEKRFDIAGHIEDVGQELVLQFENARKRGTDSNAKGFAIEKATREKIELLLPSVLGVGQGYIIDTYGNVSRQIDLVIFERSLCPVFSINESPESTYYPCEGVVAALEIKSNTGRKEFMDSCEKANSVRRLQRRFREHQGEVIFGKPIEGKPFGNRRYGQIGEKLLYEKFNPNESPFGDILTGVVTGHIRVGQDTLLSYYDQMQRNTPDILISLDGVCGGFANKSNSISNARFGVQGGVNRYEKPFSHLIALLYSWFFNGRTTSFDSYFHYFWDNNGGEVGQ